MSLERTEAEQWQIVDKFADPAATYQMKPYDLIVRPSAGAAMILTLPPVAEAKGRFYNIYSRAATPVNTITVVDKGDSEGFTKVVISEPGTALLLYSDGVKWHNIADNQIFTQKVTIPALEIKALAAAPATLVPAPGADHILEFLSATIYLQSGTEVLSEAVDNLLIKYTGAGGTILSEIIETTGFIDQLGDMTTRAIPKKDPIATPAASVNQPLVLWNNNAEFAGNASNDSALIVYITFRVINNG